MVLCIDDDPTLLDTRRLVLRAAGFRVLTANSAREALEVFSEETVDAVVLDYALQEVDGGVLATHMKRLKPRVPILMLSRQMFLPEGALTSVDAFLNSGEGPTALLNKLNSLLSLP